jgi:hypothetical protein
MGIFYIYVYSWGSEFISINLNLSSHMLANSYYIGSCSSVVSGLEELELSAFKSKEENTIESL